MASIDWIRAGEVSFLAVSARFGLTSPCCAAVLAAGASPWGTGKERVTVAAGAVTVAAGTAGAAGAVTVAAVAAGAAGAVTVAAGAVTGTAGAGKERVTVAAGTAGAVVDASSASIRSASCARHASRSPPSA